MKRGTSIEARMKQGSILLTGSYCNAPSLIVDGGSKILCPYSSKIKVISIPSGELIGVFGRHVSIVTCVRLLQSTQGMDTATHVVSSSNDGRIYVWRWTDFEVEREVVVDMDVHSFVFPPLTDFTNLARISQSKHEKSLSSFKHDLYLLTTKSRKADASGKDIMNMKKNESRSHQYKLVVYDMESSKVRKKITNVNSGHCLDHMQIREISHLVVANKRKVLFISTKTRKGPKFLSKTGNITCLAAHEKKGLLVTGHEHGEISIWHDIPQWLQRTLASPKGSVKKSKNSIDGQKNGGDTYDEEDEASITLPPVMTSLHWHAHAVRCICVSGDGGYCFSGGEEGVLVMWQLATGIKSFIPRMGGDVGYVSSDRLWDGMKVTVTTLDNSVHLIDATRMREEWTVQSLLTTSGGLDRFVQVDEVSRLDQVEAISWAIDNFQQRLRRDPVHGFMISNGAPGRLQAIDPYTRKLRWSHDVLKYTRVSRTEKCHEVYAPAVMDMVHHAAGGTIYMATIDARRSEDKMIVYSLKLWVWHETKAIYQLSAQVEEPHGTSRVNCMSFIPAGPHASRQIVSSEADSIGKHSVNYLVTGAQDGSVKLWKAAESYNRDERTQQIIWTCAFTFRHKDNPVTTLALSADGSLLALAQQDIVSFFSPLTVTFKRSLVVQRVENISFIAFVEPRFSAGTGEAYVLIGSPTKMFLVDLLTMATMWERRPAKNEKFINFAVTSSHEESLLFFNEEDEEAQESGLGLETVLKRKCGCIAVSGTNGRVSVYAIEGDASLTDFVVQGCAIGLHFGMMKSERDTAVNVPGIYCITAEGMSFLTNCLDSVDSLESLNNDSNKRKLTFGSNSALMVRSQAAALEVSGQSIADPNYSHIDLMPEDNYTVQDHDSGYGYSKENHEGATDTLGLSTTSLPSVSLLVSDFFGAHLRKSKARDMHDSGAASLSWSSSADRISIPGDYTSLRRRVSASPSLTDLPIETDSDDSAAEEESRVNMKRRRSSSLESYRGLMSTMESDNHDFIQARSSGSFNLSF